MKSLAKALLVMDLLVSKNEEMSVTEISNTLEMPKGTVHRILASLVKYKYARQDHETKKYGLGIRFYMMQSPLDRFKALRAVMNPLMRELYLKCKETVSAASLMDDEIEYIERFESEMLLRVSIRVGTRFPAHCTATGKVLLSALSDAELTQLYKSRGRLKKCTETSVTSMRELKKSLEKVREQGYARDREETLIGVNCMASPIYNLKGEMVAAISISGPRERMTPEKVAELMPLLQETTAKISQELGAPNIDAAPAGKLAHSAKS
ncbi:MAG: IclR family transcriptional regulator [Desulfarculaceae bacterium]|nr:IclR family transcriptional regulator [Desulfarculaceae bacterium]MCF8046092.1 IclR family transcriptional regulator [Desulfarculaceae bacterium]MCF8099193.1 IclR family transcriptional regulator [Desulfarculaceae bacterium]MCF8121264.1 IclR family transcriptional regulator [Desulfarculaceae bacterium]